MEEGSFILRSHYFLGYGISRSFKTKSSYGIVSAKEYHRSVEPFRTCRVLIDIYQGFPYNSNSLDLWKEFSNIEAFFTTALVLTLAKGVEGFVIYNDTSNKGYGAIHDHS